jgi:hypothetical protein
VEEVEGDGAVENGERETENVENNTCFQKDCRPRKLTKDLIANGQKDEKINSQ